MVRRRRGEPILRHHLVAYSVIGTLQVSIGLFVLMKYIEAKAWHLHSSYHGPPALIGSFYLTALGLLLLWEVVREHFSAVSGLIAPEPVKSDFRVRSLVSGDLLGGLGVSPSEWKTGPLAILFLGGPIWFLAAPMPFLPQDGIWITIGALAKALPVSLAICAAAPRPVRILWILAFAALAAIALYPDPGRESRWLIRNGIWFPLMLTATELPVVLAFCATVKGAARFFWIFGVVPIAALSTLPDFGSMRWFSFEGWLTATAAGLVLLKVSKRPRQADSHAPGLPESGDASRPASDTGRSLKQGSFELLRFLAAWACLAIFFALMVPEFPANYMPREWFPLLMGVASLPAAAWCLSLRSVRRSSVIFLILILLFGSWIILASPYAIPFHLPTKLP